jgi:hypothetical protein
MEIGQLFEFNSNGTIRKAIFKEEVDGKIVCILIGDTRTQGIQIQVEKELILWRIKK